MASAVTSIYEYPISAASAAYAPTNTAEVTAMIDSAVSGKLDASASSAFQPSGNYQTAGDYVSSSELAGYQTTAGMSAYATTAALADKLDASASSAFQPAGDYQTAGDYVSSSELADYQTTAGMSAYQTVDGMSAYQSAGDYATTADLSAKLDASAQVVTATGTSTANIEGYVYTWLSQVNGLQISALTSDVAAHARSATRDSNGNIIKDTYATTAALSAKLDASASSAFITSTAGLVSTGDLENYQTTAGMSGYATTGDLSAKLDASASSAFVTSTAGLVSTGDLENYQTTAGMSGYATTGDLSAKLDASASSAFITSTAGLVSTGDLENYQTTAGMSGYATTGDLSAKLDASASSAFLTSQVQASWSETSSSSPAYIVDRPAEGTLSAGDYMDISVSGNVVTLGVTGVATTADLSAKMDASASSAFITSTAGLVSTGDLSSYLATSSIGVDTASAITSIAGSSIAGGGGGTTYTAGQYIQISGDEISVTGINPGDYAQSSSLADYQTTAAMSAYATTGDLSAKLDASASSAFLTAQEQASWSETASSSPSYIVDKPDLVDIVAGPGIVVDNPDGNTLRVSVAADYEVELYKHNTVAETNVNDVFTMSEPITNFERIRIEFWNREFQYHRISFEYFVTDAVADSTQFIAALDASLGTSIIQRVNMAVGFNAAGNLVDKGHGLFYGNGSSYTNSSNRGLGIHRVVGIHRIANN